ncbi:MAG: BrnA antitoxin family protein [Sphaerochaetaceae bacterium]|nr:BrnA antitoxin family protein [Sphaerochaetaceae bacterium]
MNKAEKEIEESLEIANVVEDFLPPPSQLMKRQKKERITISLDASCLEFFKEAALKTNSKYQTMINEVLVQYANHYSK